MKRLILALFALAATALPAFAADTSTPMPGGAGMSSPGMKGQQNTMHKHPEVMRYLMQDPAHRMAMAYHKNLTTFALTLKKLARQGDTVPRDLARAAVTEMRRSADQMEMYHEQAMRNLPPNLKAEHAEMSAKMGGHLAQMRSQLAQLDQFTKADRIDSKELVKQLDLLFQGCKEICHGAGMCGEKKHGKRGCGGCSDCGSCGGCGESSGCGGNSPNCADKAGYQEMAERHQKMMDRMKAEDAEISRLVDKMNNAPSDLKQSVIADILTRMVRQHNEMSLYMESTRGEMERRHLGGAWWMMQNGADSDSADPDQMNADRQQGDDSDLEDADADSPDMEMEGITMEE